MQLVCFPWFPPGCRIYIRVKCFCILFSIFSPKMTDVRPPLWVSVFYVSLVRVHTVSSLSLLTSVYWTFAIESCASGLQPASKSKCVKHLSINTAGKNNNNNNKKIPVLFLCRVASCLRLVLTFFSWNISDLICFLLKSHLLRFPPVFIIHPVLVQWFPVHPPTQCGQAADALWHKAHFFLMESSSQKLNSQSLLSVTPEIYFSLLLCPSVFPVAQPALAKCFSWFIVSNCNFSAVHKSAVIGFYFHPDSSVYKCQSLPYKLSYK